MPNSQAFAAKTPRSAARARARGRCPGSPGQACKSEDEKFALKEYQDKSSMRRVTLHEDFLWIWCQVQRLEGLVNTMSVQCSDGFLASTLHDLNRWLSVVGSQRSDSL